jgi:glycosyltransferase involved in cell wall biosynthesis
MHTHRLYCILSVDENKVFKKGAMHILEKPTVVIIKFGSWKAAHQWRNHPEYSAIHDILSLHRSKINFVLVGTSKTSPRGTSLVNGAIAYDIKAAGVRARALLAFNLNLLKLLFVYRPRLIIVLGLLNMLPVAVYSLLSWNSRFVPILIGEFGYHARKVNQFLMTLFLRLLGISLQLSQKKILDAFALSNYVRRYIEKLAPNLSGKIRLIAYPISSIFCSTQQKNISKQSDQPIVLTVAAIEPRKGIDTLLKASVFLPEKVKIMIKGGVRDSAYMNELRALVVNLKLEDKVTFIKDFTDYDALVSYYKSATVFAFPTRDDCLGVVVLEALHCGLPVVATSVGGIPDMIENGVNGILVKADDPRELANAIMSLLTNDNLRAKLAGNARSVLNSRYYQGRITLQEALMQSIDALYIEQQPFLSSAPKIQSPRNAKDAEASQLQNQKLARRAND